MAICLSPNSPNPVLGALIWSILPKMAKYEKVQFFALFMNSLYYLHRK